MRVLVGTRNAAKARRLRWLLERLGLDLVAADELARAEPPELAGSHRSIAEAKARHWSEGFDGLAVASDGGISVPALGAAWDSVRTRRAAGRDATDIERAEHLLSLARHLRGADRQVRRVEALAIAREGRVLASWEFDLPVGTLVERFDPAQIADGFWLPALIYLPEFGKTYAELSEGERGRLRDPWNALRPKVRAFVRGLLVRERLRGGRSGKRDAQLPVGQPDGNEAVPLQRPDQAD